MTSHPLDLMSRVAQATDGWAQLTEDEQSDYRMQIHRVVQDMARAGITPDEAATLLRYYQHLPMA